MRKVICGKYSCAFNNCGLCGLNIIGIDANGQCINYKKYGFTDETVIQHEESMQEMCRKALNKE